MLDLCHEDIDGMDDDAGDEEEPLPTGHWTPTSPHDVYMVDTPKENDDEERKDAAKGCSAKSRLGRSSNHINPAIEQGEPADDKHGIEPSSDHSNMENQTEQPNSVEDNSPDDITPDRHPEQQNTHQRLVATTRSLKKQKQSLRAAQDTLRIRWSEVLNTTAKYGGNRQTKSYPKRKLLPEFDEEALDPPQSKNKTAIRLDR